MRSPQSIESSAAASAQDQSVLVQSMPSQSVSLAVFKLLGVFASSILLAGLLVRVVRSLVETGPAEPLFWLALPSLLLGYLLADLMSGTAHWFCDTFFNEETPLIGKVLIKPFRDHHGFPGRITRYRFVEQDTSNFFILLLPLAFAWLSDAPEAASWAGLFWCCALSGLALGSFFTNLFHKWAHQRQPPAGVRWLQRRGLILSPERHALHHRDHSRGFCVTSGWMNPVLDRVRFFARMERAVRALRR